MSPQLFNLSRPCCRQDAPKHSTSIFISMPFPFPQHPPSKWKPPSSAWHVLTPFHCLSVLSEFCLVLSSLTQRRAGPAGRLLHVMGKDQSRVVMGASAECASGVSCIHSASHSDSPSSAWTVSHFQGPALMLNSL